MAKGSARPRKAPATATRSIAVPGPEDLELAKDDALLQLRIGRYTHFYTIVISAALALDGILLLYFQPHLDAIAPGSWGTSFYLLLPIGAGVMIAAVGLASKWEEYNLWPWEAHFAASVAALAANALILFVFVAHVANYGAFGGVALWSWYYPVILAGISFALIGLVLTWRGWSFRQWASAFAAVLPVATALVVLFPPSGATSLDSALAISLFISAILYQMSGSLLHLISSGTRSQERELITSGQTRMFRLADEVRQRDEALRFREAALVKREADVENDEMSIERQQAALGEARSQLEHLEEDYRTRSDAVVATERTWAGKIADLEGRERAVADRTQALELREQEVQRSTPLISGREQRLVAREGELTQREVELTQRAQDIDRRAAALPESEARLEARKKELDQKTVDLLRREGAVSAAESGGKSIASGSPAGAPDLANRELQLQQLKSVLDEQNVTLGRRAKETAERARSVEAALKVSIAKEAALASREAAVQQREADLDGRSKAVEERRGAYETAARDYESRLATIGRTQVETAQKAAAVDQGLKSLAEREAAVGEREKRARAAQTDVETRERSVHARERALSANEAELSLRRQETARAGDLGAAMAAAAGAGSRMGLGTGSGTARGREPGVRDLSTEESVAPAAETLHVASQRRIADRIPTGTPRLDDLLLGGLPPKSHVVLLGDAFVGKEIVLYAFVAEGLKRGEPIVIVTASRGPTEVAQSLGVVLPQFREYEQMGMVTWIDASGPASGPSDPHRLTTTGSDDRAGILSNLVRAAKAADGERSAPFRVGFLGLAGVLAHVDERAAFSFLQNVVGILKPRNALAVYSLESGALSDAQVETLLGRMDGALVFRQDRDKTFLQVKGLGEVQTHDWIECRATNRALIVGSFALERIR